MFKWIFIWVFLPVLAFAATEEELVRLHAALRTPEIIAILSEEGIASAEELRASMFPGRDGGGWAVSVQDIHNTERLSQIFKEAFEAKLAASDMTNILAFLESAQGANITALEIETRRAFSSDAVKNAAHSAFETLRRQGNSKRLDLLNKFEALNELVDQNVAGALNSSLAFYRGLTDSGQFEMTQDQILNEVWGQEDDIRQDTFNWVFGFMTMAYDQIEDADLAAYVAFSESDAGQELNKALFAGYDTVFLRLSYDLGRLAGQFMIGEEL